MSLLSREELVDQFLGALANGSWYEAIKEWPRQDPRLWKCHWPFMERMKVALQNGTDIPSHWLHPHFMAWCGVNGHKTSAVRLPHIIKGARRIGWLPLPNTKLGSAIFTLADLYGRSNISTRSKDAPVEPKKEEKKEEKTEETEEAERTEEWPGIEEWQSLHLQKTAYGSESISVLQRSYRIYVGDFHSFEDEEFALVLRARLGVVDDGEDVKGWRHVVRLPVPDPWSQNTFSWQARQVINRAAVEAARLRAEYKVKKTKRFLEPLIGPPTEHACSIDLFDFVIRARSKPRKKWYMEREQWALFRRECADAAKEQRPLKPGICVAEEDLIVRKIGEEDPRIELRNQDGLFAGRVLLPGEIIPYKMYVMLEHQLKPEDEDLFNLYGFDLDTILLKKPRTHGKKQSKKKTEENAKEDCYALCGTAMLPFGNKSGKINDWRLEITEESAHAKATPQCLELQNCRFFVTLYEMEPMVHLQMIKRVEKHEELLTDYGTPYWLNWLAARKSEQIKKKRKKRKNEEEKEKNDENEEPRLMMMMECPNCGCRVVAPAKYCPAGCQFRRQCLGCHALLAAPPHDKCCSMCGLAVVVKA